MIPPEDVREQIRQAIHPVDFFPVQASALLGTTPEEMLEEQAIYNVSMLLASAKAAGIEIGRKQKGNSGRLQYQDGYKAGKTEGYTQGMHESVKHVDEGFAQGVKAMQEVVKEELRYDNEYQDYRLNSKEDVDDIADQLLK